MQHGRKIAVIGLGYVGLPVAIAFARTGTAVVGFDIDHARIDELRAGRDRTREVEPGELAQPSLRYESDSRALAGSDFYIVTVPTPIDAARRPDLRALMSASDVVGRVLKRGDIVVYESTVYPGCIEEDCAPILERVSGLKAGSDFTVGYSPERINPGDRQHRFETIMKVVSGQDERTLEIVANVYGSVVKAGVHQAPSIRVAEAAKVIENTQRDLNIALMNELAIIFGKLGIDTTEVLQAAGTKWNFLKFRPGLVGGHCIGVDPYYLTYKAETLGYHPQVILAGRRINDGMGKFIADKTIKLMAQAGSPIAGARAVVLGLTFKENCPDLRNSRVLDIVHELESFGVKVDVHDPVADAEEAAREYGIQLQDWDALPRADALVVAVAHEHLRQMPIGRLSSLVKPGGVVVDVKACLDAAGLLAAGLKLWRL